MAAISRCMLVCSLAACGGSDNGGFGRVHDAPAITNPTHVWAFAPDDVWVLDGTANVQRFDGAAWTAFPTPSTSGLGCIFALSPTDVYLCTDSEVLHYNGTAFTKTDVTAATGLSGLTALWAASASDVFVVGGDAIVAHFDGASWSRTIAGSSFKTSIWGSGPHDVYALSTFELSHFDGSGWAPITLDSGGGDGQVWGTSASDVWAMTGSTQVSHFDGSAWKTSDLDIVGDLAAVWGATADDVWASGSGGAIAHWNGSKWSEVAHQQVGAPFLQQLVSVHGSGADDIWIVGHQLGDGGASPLIFHRGS